MQVFFMCISWKSIVTKFCLTWVKTDNFTCHVGHWRDSFMELLIISGACVAKEPSLKYLPKPDHHLVSYYLPNKILGCAFSILLHSMTLLHKALFSLSTWWLDPMWFLDWSLHSVNVHKMVILYGNWVLLIGKTDAPYLMNHAHPIKVWN